INEEAQTDALHVFREKVLGELPGKGHQVVVGDRAGDNQFHDCAGSRYLPIIGARSCLTCGDIASGRVTSANFSADAHSHVRSKGSRATAPAMMFCAIV